MIYLKSLQASGSANGKAAQPGAFADVAFKHCQILMLFASLFVGCLKHLKQIVLFLSQNSIPILEAKLDTPLGLKWMEKFLDVTDLGVTCNLATMQT